MEEKIQIEDYLLKSGSESPALYVGTYAKYNQGSIDGAWIDLEKCGSYDVFMEVCEALHSDEDDPEFMFQDFMYFPEDWYSESFIDEDVFDRIVEYAALDDDEKEILDAYMLLTCNRESSWSDAQDAYIGKYESPEDYAWEVIEEQYGDNQFIMNYIDASKFAQDLFYDYSFQDGRVFYLR